MAIAYVVRVGDLLPELLANALIFLRALHTAGAIAAGALQAVPDGLNHFFIFIEPNCHGVTSFLESIIEKNNPMSR